ncbi:hypothetical protein KIPB_007312, partial [Kipferlia bialata]
MSSPPLFSVRDISEQQLGLLRTELQGSQAVERDTFLISSNTYDNGQGRLSTMRLLSDGTVQRRGYATASTYRAGACIGNEVFFYRYGHPMHVLAMDTKETREIELPKTGLEECYDATGFTVGGCFVLYAKADRDTRQRLGCGYLATFCFYPEEEAEGFVLQHTPPLLHTLRFCCTDGETAYGLTSNRKLVSFRLDSGWTELCALPSCCNNFSENNDGMRCSVIGRCILVGPVLIRDTSAGRVVQRPQRGRWSHRARGGQTRPAFLPNRRIISYDTVSGEWQDLGEIPDSMKETCCVLGMASRTLPCAVYAGIDKRTEMLLHLDPCLFYPHPDMGWARPPVRPIEDKANEPTQARSMGFGAAAAGTQPRPMGFGAAAAGRQARPMGFG